MKLAAKIFSGFIGVVLFITGLYVILRDIHVGGVSHGTNALVGGLSIIFGLALMLPAITFAVAKQILELIGPYLPQIRIGGRRVTDPPSNAPSKPEDDPNASIGGSL